METENISTNEKRCWELLDQLAIAFIQTYNPSLSCQIPFSLSIDSKRQNRISRWIGMQDSNLLQTVFSDLLKLLNCDNKPKGFTNPGDKRIQRIYEYVLSNYSREIRLQRLASDTGMTEPALCSFFKKATGEHFVDYVNRIRIDHATRQLLGTNDSVSGIGYSCGFNTVNYFIRIFKKLKGCTPGEYRKLVKS